MIPEISQHRSIRRYTDRKLSQEILDDILAAAVRAPNTGNMQMYSIIVTTDEAVKHELMPAHFNQPMIEQAAAVLTFCADINRFNKWCDLRQAKPGYDNLLWFVTATVDANLAAQNACLQAEAHGLGTCFLGTVLYNADVIVDVLKLPKGVVPVATLTIGYPDENPPLTNRLPVEAVVHYQKYSDYNELNINELYKEQEQLPENVAAVKDNKKANLAQVFTDVRYPENDNITFSETLLKTLKKQGFL